MIVLVKQIVRDAVEISLGVVDPAAVTGLQQAQGGFLSNVLGIVFIRQSAEPVQTQALEMRIKRIFGGGGDFLHRLVLIG